MPLHYENEKEVAHIVSPIYARKTAPTAKKRPPIETMLAAAAPVDWGALAEEAPLAPPAEAVEEGLLPEPVPEAEPLLGRAELATGTLVLPAGGAIEVARVGGTTKAELAIVGNELAIAGTELAASGTELAISDTELATSGTED